MSPEGTDCDSRSAQPAVCQPLSSASAKEQTIDVVLIHGAYHGPWCWDLLSEALRARGHGVVCPELPIDDPSAGTAAYADAVTPSIVHLDEPVLVAHSMAGTVSPLVAAARPIRKLVFLAAFLAKPGTSCQQQRQKEPVDPPYEPSRVEFTPIGEDLWTVGDETATEIFFHDVPPDRTAWALARLRPQCYRWMTETTPLQAWPEVPVAAVVCTDDHAINPDWVRTAAQDRLGIEAREIDGGHSPFLSRPAELAELLDGLFADG